MIETYIQILFNGLIIGSLYALTASGLSLIYNVNKFIHLAHGIVITVTAYVTFWLSQMLGLNFYLTCVFSILFSGVFGVLIYVLLYKPLIARKINSTVLIIASFSILFLFENLILMIFGADLKTYRYSSNVLSISGINITNVQLSIILITILIFCILWLLLNKSTFGKSIRAVADNRDLAQVLGVNVDRVILFSFFAGSLIAGIGGVLIGLEQNLEPTMGMSFIIKGFAGSIIGGLTSIPGSIGGSYFIGIIENFGVWFLPSQFKQAITFVILFLFLLIRPQGMFGVKTREG